MSQENSSQTSNINPLWWDSISTIEKLGPYQDGYNASTSESSQTNNLCKLSILNSVVESYKKNSNNSISQEDDDNIFSSEKNATRVFSPWEMKHQPVYANKYETELHRNIPLDILQNSNGFSDSMQNKMNELQANIQELLNLSTNSTMNKDIVNYVLKLQQKFERWAQLVRYK